MKTKLLLILLIFIFSLASVNADELFLQNETTENLEDTFIDEANPDLDNGNDVNIIIGENGANEQQVFIKFSISQIPVGSTITKAEFGFFEIIDNTEILADYSIYQVDNQTWNENEVTFNNQPSTGDIINATANPTIDPDGFILFNVLTWVINQSDQGLTNVSFNVNKSLDAGGGNDQVNFRSKGIANQTQRPFLNITFLPLTNLSNLDVFLSKNPIEILEEFTLFANYTNASNSGSPILNATCFANSSIVGGGTSGFGRGILGIGELSTIGNAVHTQLNDIFGNNTLRVDIDNIPIGKSAYAINLRFHAHNQTPNDDLRIFATCHNNLTFSNFTLFGQVNASDAIISTSTGNDTIWGFKNLVLFGETVASENCSIVFESVNTTIDKHWMIADTISTGNLNNSFTSTDFGETYVLRTNADTRSPFVDAGFGLDVPNETTMLFNSTSNLYFLPNIRHGRPFDFEDRVFCSQDQFENATNFVVTNVQDNVAPITQIASIDPRLAILNVDNVTITWVANDPELLTKFINVSFPNGSLLLQSENNPLIIDFTQLPVIGNYTVTVFANDTGGLSSTANDSFIVADVDITPPNITLISLVNNTINNTIPLNITISVIDNFPNPITCIFSNTSVTFSEQTFIQSQNVNFTLAEGETALSQNFPNLQFTCFDNSPNNNSATLLLNLTLDTNPPILILNSPLNNTIFDKLFISSIQLNSNCTDVPVFRLNMTIRNSTNGIIESVETQSVTNNLLSINQPLDITTLPAGDYDLVTECADPHTSREIKNWNVRKNNSEDSIRYVTDKGNQFKIRYLQNSLAVLSYGSNKATTNDKYDFFFNMNGSKASRTYIFELISRSKVTYLPDSDYNGHFVTGNNWIDFNLNDPDATYVVSLNGNGNYEVEVTTTLTSLNFNSVGDLNIVILETTFKIDDNPPIIEQFNIRSCPLENLQSTILFIFFLVFSLVVMWMGFHMRIGIVGFLGAVILLILSTFLFSCLIVVAGLITAVSLAMMSFFTVRGTSNSW